VRTFACGHVIPPESVLPLALSRGPTGLELDFTFAARKAPAMMDELGRVLLNACAVCPKGAVCFLPSYDYEEAVAGRWAATGLLARLAAKKAVFREPKAAADVPAVLAAYGDAVAKGGALLLCVVGAKLGEGINFSDDLARCVVMVGLPYADRGDPELREKMAFLDAQRPSGGREYYENLCMRAVNQSIGRSIRHIGDYSAILLCDQRYSTKRSVLAKLPAWIGERVQHCGDFGAAVKHLRGFFVARAAQRPSAPP
jgi:chromosome transmission fidelity protein 1